MTTIRIPDDEKGITPVFETRAVRNEKKSKDAGMAMYDDVEFCRIYIAGYAKEKQLDVPAHDVWSIQNRMGPDGPERVPVTYAERFTKQYQQFKSGNSQTFSGTPLTELTSLTPAQRSMLKGLQIHTLQALAAIDGISLKQLGAGGRELKNAALAFLENAQKGVLTGEVADKLSQQENEIEKLKQQLASMAPQATFPVPDDVSQTPPVTTADVATYETFNDEDLRNMLEAAGVVVDGRWSRNTLITKCKELKTKAKVAA